LIDLITDIVPNTDPIPTKIPDNTKILKSVQMALVTVGSFIRSMIG
jgi:hypothetical protein